MTDSIRFTPYAWAKLCFIRDFGKTEIGGFGVTSPNDPLQVIDFVMVRQECSVAFVRFDDDAVNEFFNDQADLGRHPQNYGRIWIHTHPGNSAHPSGTDEDCFREVFGHCDWAVMFILARGGETYCRLGFNVGPRGRFQLKTEIDYSLPFEGTNHEAWTAEYKKCWREKIYAAPAVIRRDWQDDRRLPGGVIYRGNDEWRMWGGIWYKNGIRAPEGPPESKFRKAWWDDDETKELTGKETIIFDADDLVSDNYPGSLQAQNQLALAAESDMDFQSLAEQKEYDAAWEAWAQENPEEAKAFLESTDLEIMAEDFVPLSQIEQRKNSNGKITKAERKAARNRAAGSRNFAGNGILAAKRNTRDNGRGG